MITSPFIEQHEKCVADGVELTIADTEGVFENIQLVNGNFCRNIQFEIKQVPLTNANGIISVLDSQSQIMWSWFISVRGEGISVSEYTNHDGDKLTLMDFNLGDLYDDDTRAHTKSWFWQWGRMMPQICSKSYNENINHTTFGASGFTQSLVSSSIGYAIQHPEQIISAQVSPYNWYTGTTSHYNLWDAKAITAEVTSDSVKSVYDPCPPGFKVAVGTAFNGFGSSTMVNAVGNFADGWNFKRNSTDIKGRFFSASGWRGYLNGSIDFASKHGQYWTSSSFSQFNAYYLTFDSLSVYTLNYAYHSSGQSIRGQAGF